MINKNHETNYDGYKFSMFEVDIVNKLLYEIRTTYYNDKGNNEHGANTYYRFEDRLYDYKNHTLITDYS